MFQRSERFAPRSIQWLGNHESHGWRVKRYSILAPNHTLDTEAADAVLKAAVAELPQPAVTIERPGVGFVIYHAGRGMDYVGLNWWARENEHFQRVWVRPQSPGAGYRPATQDESDCVWDLEVVWFERQSYVRHVLAAPDGPDIEGYLAERLGGGATVKGEPARTTGGRAADRLEQTDPIAYRDRLTRQVGDRRPLDVMAETPDALERLAGAHPAELLRRRPFEGKWTPLEILGHLLDAEWVFAFRTRTILGDDRPDIVGMDQDLWVAAQRYNERSPEEILSSFRAVRNANLALWRRLSDRELGRVGVHRERGEESLGQILGYAAGHDLWHQDQFRRYVAAVGGEAAGQPPASR